MKRFMLKSKIHDATVTEANVDYTGSITVDETLMDAADLIQYEKVLLADLTNGARVETYVIPAKRNSSTICANGATAKIIDIGDKILIMAFTILEDKEAKKFKPKIIFLDEKNKIKTI